MGDHKLSLEETRSINNALRLKMQELDRVISEAGRVVSQLTHYPAFISSAASARARAPL
jgi:heat-inducible transcriptional repressor